MRKKAAIFFLYCVSALAGWSRADEVSLNGVVFFDDEAYAYLLSAENGRWVKSGGAFLSYTVKSVALENVILAGPDGVEQRLHLVKARIRKSESQLLALEALDWTWIKSDLNPMRQDAPELSFDVARRWNDLSETERIDIRNNYRRHGWDVIVEVGKTKVTADRFRLREPGYEQSIPRDRVVASEKLILPNKKQDE